MPRVSMRPGGSSSKRAQPRSERLRPSPGQARHEGPGEHARGPHRPPQELEGPQPVKGRGGDAERAAGPGGRVVVHLARGHPRGEEGGHEGAARDPDVQVEVEDAAAEELVEGAQAADLVDRPGDAPARADERDLGLPAGAVRLAARHARPPAESTTARSAARARSAAEAAHLPRELLDAAGELLHLLPAGDVEGGEGALDGIVHGPAERALLLPGPCLETAEPALHLAQRSSALAVEATGARRRGRARRAGCPPRCGRRAPSPAAHRRLGRAERGPGLLPRLLEPAARPPPGARRPARPCGLLLRGHLRPPHLFLRFSPRRRGGAAAGAAGFSM
jgi:hypothetical protein